jgi:hypothetical protein
MGCAQTSLVKRRVYMRDTHACASGRARACKQSATMSLKCRVKWRVPESASSCDGAKGRAERVIWRAG